MTFLRAGRMVSPPTFKRKLYSMLTTIPNEVKTRRISQQDSLTMQVGNTPLLRLAHLPRQRDISPQVKLYAKAEWFNPSGSVKDRAALYMIRDGEERGLLT